MMKKKNYLRILAMGLMIVASCKRSSNVDVKPSHEKYADIIVQMERVTNEMEFIARYVTSNVVQYPDDGNYLGKGIIARKGTIEGQEITIDFGAGGVCTDGKFRSGKLVIEFNETNFDTMIRPQAYQVDGVEIRGDYSIGYVAGSNRMRLNLIVLNGRLAKANQYSADFTSNRKSDFIQGAGTVDQLADDRFDRSELTSDMTVNSSGATVLLKIRGNGISKLDFSCSDRYYPTTGQLKVDFTGAKQGSYLLTFGNGSCNGRPILN